MVLCPLSSRKIWIHVLAQGCRKETELDALWSPVLEDSWLDKVIDVFPPLNDQGQGPFKQLHSLQPGPLTGNITQYLHNKINDSDYFQIYLLPSEYTFGTWGGVRKPGKRGLESSASSGRAPAGRQSLLLKCSRGRRTKGMDGSELLPGQGFILPNTSCL